MELNLQTPISCPSSRGMCLHSRSVYPPQKYICKYNKIAKIGEITFLFNKSKSVLTKLKLTFAKSKFVKFCWKKIIKNLKKVCQI